MKLRWGYYRCLEEKTERSIGSESIFNAQRHFPKLINYTLGNDIGIGLKRLRLFKRQRMSYHICVLSNINGNLGQFLMHLPKAHGRVT